MRKISKVSMLHYVKLIYRTILFILALYWYIFHKNNNLSISIRDIDFDVKIDWFVYIIDIVYVIEMILRLFPSNLESPGCQKVFRRNYMPTGETNIEMHDNHATIIVALIWIVLNGFIGGLFMLGLIDEGILWLVCLFYGICDMICILFFCPFQTWFLKNKCCTLCRIYNWDFAMMFTPLFFIPSFETWSILLIALIVLIKWELTVWKYPEQFSENTNEYLKCKNCNEKLCMHKKQLVKFRLALNDLAAEQIKRILKK